MPRIMMRWIAVTLCFVVVGCSNQFSMITNEIESIEPADFAVAKKGVESAQAPPLEQDSTDGESTISTSASTTPEDMESQTTEEVVVDAPRPTARDMDPLIPKSVGVPLTVEALVGQVNGHPIYANTVLEPIADQLQAVGKKSTRSTFSDTIRSALYSESDNMGTTLHSGRMYELVITELLLTEALSNMSEEQQYGLLSVINKMRKDLASAEGGSQTGARTIVQEQVGISVDKFLKLQRDKILIDALYRQQIWPRVNVTWRDIQREFEPLAGGKTTPVAQDDTERTAIVVGKLRRGMQLSNIPEAFGSVTLGMIRLKKDDPKVSQVVEGFEKGLPFAEVATLAGISNGGEWESFKMGSGGISDIESSDIIKSHLEGAEEGDVIGSFELGSGDNPTLIWLSVLHVQEPISMYNRMVQIELHNRLRWIQFNREKNRFVDSLWGEGSLDEVKAMADRVASIAVRRYLP